MGRTFIVHNLLQMLRVTEGSEGAAYVTTAICVPHAVD